MPPYFKLSGRTAFDNAIENNASPGRPDIAGGRIALFCDVFHFRDDKICRLVTYQVDRHPGGQTHRAFDA